MTDLTTRLAEALKFDADYINAHWNGIATLDDFASAKAERARTAAVDRAVVALTKAAQDVMWVNECRCDEAWTGRKMHEPNAFCGELDNLAEALAQLAAAMGEK
jgi:hypothetical protein